MRAMPRVVMATLGSYGDINPYLAIGRELKRRGHTPVLATGDIYAKDAAREGIEFAAVPPNGDPNDPALMARVMDQLRGSEVVVRELIVPIIRDAYAALEHAADGADLLLSHPLTFAAPILAEKRGLPWLSVALQPIMFFSAYDPPVVAPAPWLARLRRLGPGFNGRLLRLMKRVSYSWTEPVRTLRRELGLPADVDPIFEGGVSPYGVLGMFSRAFAEPQPDWPPRVHVCGFPFLDEDFGGSTGLDPALAAFLDAGPAPIVFTLGSSAVHTAGDFYTQAAVAASRLGRRAVLLAGAASETLRDLTAGAIAVRSAPYHELFPRAAAIVHSGGIGTTAQALRSGRPQIVVPYAHDQFDNASRVERLGAGTWLRRGRRRAARLAAALARLLADADIAAQAARAAQIVRGESGTASACDAIEAVIRRS
jgi:UDP:flavonoid glycosyltransferase YjiC (YdhE family)